MWGTGPEAGTGVQVRDMGSAGEAMGPCVPTLMPPQWTLGPAGTHASTGSHTVK